MQLKFEHNDIECYQKTLDNLGFQVNVLQTSKGFYKRKSKILVLPSMLISSHLQNDCARLFQGIFSFDEFVLGIPINDVDTYLNGTLIQKAGLCLIGPGESVHIPADSTLESIHIVIKQSLLIDYLGSEKVSQLKSNLSSIRANRSASKQFFQLKAKIVQYALHAVSSNMPFGLQSIMDIQDTLCSLVCKTLLEISEGHNTHNSSYNSRLEIVKRATRYIDSQPNFNIQKSNILKHSFCSVRSLEYAFQTILSLSPKRYLMLRKMHVIKNELYHQKHVHIKDVLTRYGVVNHGRFSQEFYLLFGLYPRDVVKNNGRIAQLK